jgi:hypothetical protein
MPYNAEPGKVAYVVAHAQLTHGDLAADNGFVGEAVKTATPAADTPRANRNIIAVGEAYTLLIGKVVRAPSASLPGIAKGALVWINTTTNALATAAGTGLQILGRVSSLPGERGTGADSVRINLEQKV